MEHQPTPEQSLKLINEMIIQAKRSFQKVHFYFLMWGVLLAIAGVGAHLLAASGSHYNWVVWPAAGLIGGIIAGVKGSRDGKKQHITTMMDRVHQWLWVSFMITLLIMIIALVNIGQDPNPFVLVLTGLPTFVSGALMRFRPLMVGGVLFWMIGFISFFAFHEYTALIYSIAITVGYIIPGLMLKRAEDGVRTT